MSTATQPQAQAVLMRTGRIVTDLRTGLEWSDTLRDHRLTHAEAEQACRELRLGGHTDWRLPTITELAGLIDYTRHSPAIDIARFSDTQSSAYWTSSPVASSPDYAWFVYFLNGYVNGDHRDSYAWVRAVRGPRASQSLPFDATQGDGGAAQPLATRGTGYAERSNAQRDAILVTLKQAGQRLTLSAVADAIDATLSDTADALDLLSKAGLVNVDWPPLSSEDVRCTFGINHAAVLS